jgi:DNA replication protein DnaC
VHKLGRNNANRRDFLELIDDRYQRASTLITSQLPMAKQANTAVMQKHYILSAHGVMQIS